MARSPEDQQGIRQTTSQSPAPSPSPAPTAPAASTSSYTVLDFVHALEAALGVPTSPNNDSVLVAWQAAEGNPGWGQYNPYNIAATSVNQPGGGTARFNGWDDGVTQTAEFLRRNPAYSGIINSLAVDAPPSDTARIIGSSPWAAGHYSFPQYGNGEPGGSIIANLGKDGNYSPGGPTSGTGGGGTAGTSGGNADPATYAQYSFLLSDPQIGGYLQQLASGSISDATFQADVQNSDWWKTHSGSARAFLELKNSDPASYKQQLGEYSRQIVEQATQLGIGLDIPTIAKLANQWGMENWTSQDLTNALLSYSSPGHASAGLAYGEDQIRQAAAQYGINLNSDQAYQYELQVAQNRQTLNGITANFAQQAKNLYPHLGSLLDQGYTLQQLATPYIDTAAKVLQIDPQTVNLADPKWSRALAFHDGNQVRQMTQYEWTQTLMQDPTYGYDNTQGGQQEAAALGKSLVGTMTGTQL